MGNTEPRPAARRGGTTGGRPGAFRRYPAAVFLVAAAALATFLPSTLIVPLTGPSQAAELAPVPGQSDGAGAIEGLEGTSTAGLGSGPRGESTERGGPPEVASTDPPSNGSGGNPLNKRCVGKPPRQTEDPMSPACVGFFNGDNGGATAKGVTGDEIRIVIESCDDGNGVPEQVIDYNTDDPARNPTIAAYASYFTERYQTYERRARFIETRRGPPCHEDGAARRAEIVRVDERFTPFAVINTNFWAASPGAADQAAQLGIVTLIDSPGREFMRQRAPYLYSVTPDVEDYSAMTAEFLCHRLAGRPARHSGDPTDRGRTRTFGLVYNKGNDKEGIGARLVVEEVARRCGSVATVKDYGLDSMPAMRADQITTVVNMTEHIFDFVDAESMGWHPEWYVPVADNFPAYSPAMPANQWRNAFGFLLSRRLGVRAQQAAYVAAEDACAGCGEHADPYLYERLLLLFTGIQAAGPRLTPANVDRGLHALRPVRSFDPYLPAAYLAPGNYSWMKDAAAVWWDPSGRPPGHTSLGCFRLIEGGLRYRAEDWKSKPGDGGIKGADGTEQPCQGR